MTRLKALEENKLIMVESCYLWMIENGHDEKLPVTNAVNFNFLIFLHNVLKCLT